MPGREDRKKKRRLGGLHVLPLLALLSIAGACSDDGRVPMAKDIDPETRPTMTTRDVETLISDSGVIRYRISTPLWLVYDEAKEPIWRFPDGLHLDRFDNLFNKEASVDCDSATYFKDKQLWRLDGHVRVLNMAGEKFLTQQLFWDQRREEVYSDSFIHIERIDRMMEGYGFTSNSQMTKFKVKNVSAILPMSQFRSEGEDYEPLDEEGGEIIDEPMGPEEETPEDSVDTRKRKRPAITPRNGGGQELKKNDGEPIKKKE